MDKDQSIDETILDIVIGVDHDSRANMTTAEELVERMPYKPEYEDPLGDF